MDSVSVIGGADEPTKIFLAGNPVGIAVAAVLIIIVSVLLCFFFKNKKNRHRRCPDEKR